MLKQEQLRKFIVLIDQLVELVLQGNICWIRDVTGLTLDDLRLYRERAMTELGKYVFKPYIGWVIVGGESGPGARPFDMDWARSLRDQCQDARVPFFLKQGRIDGRLVKMPELDGRVWDQYPEVEKL